MTFEEHCQESERLFGERFEGVHRWLDEFMGTPEYRMRHRKVRHHEEGIRQVLELFGEKASQVARRHIMSDLMLEGWVEGVHPFPKNERDFVRMGLY